MNCFMRTMVKNNNHKTHVSILSRRTHSQNLFYFERIFFRWTNNGKCYEKFHQNTLWISINNFSLLSFFLCFFFPYLCARFNFTFHFAWIKFSDFSFVSVVFRIIFCINLKNYRFTIWHDISQIIICHPYSFIFRTHINAAWTHEWIWMV